MYVSSRPRCRGCPRGRIEDRVVYDASMIGGGWFFFSLTDEYNRIHWVIGEGRGTRCGERGLFEREDRSIFGIEEGRGNRGSKTLRSAHKYVNAIQEDNEPLKVVHRRRTGSCVPANLIAVVFTMMVSDEWRERIFREICLRVFIEILLSPFVYSILFHSPPLSRYPPSTLKIETNERGWNLKLRIIS